MFLLMMISFALNTYHLLNSLLMLELMMMLPLMTMIMLTTLMNNMFITHMMMLAIVITVGVFGLGVLVFVSQMNGSSYIKSYTFMMY